MSSQFFDLKPGKQNMGSLSVQEVKSFEAIRDLHTEWDSLAESENLGPAHQFEWMNTLWEVHRNRGELVIILVREDGRLVGVAPLVKQTEKRRGIQFQVLQGLNGFHAVHGTQLIISNSRLEVTNAILEYIQTRHSEWNLWFMHFQQDEKQASVFPSALQKEKLHHSVVSTERSPYMRLEGSWDDLLKSLQPRFRTALRSRERKLKENGTVEFQFMDSVENWRKGMDSIVEIEEDGWKSLAGTAVTRKQYQLDFYRRYAAIAAASSTLRIPVLYFNGEPVAYDYSLYQNGIYYLLKTSYKEKYRDHYPGFVLRKFLIEWLFKVKAEEIDFLGTDEEWKMKWTTTVRSHVCYIVYNRNWKSRYALTFHRLGQFIKRRS